MHTDYALNLVRTALNKPRRRPVALIVLEYGCIADRAHAINKKGQYQQHKTQVDGIAKNDYAHRVVFRAHNGESSLNGGLEVDHICRTTFCLNINHLQAVTPQENKVLGAHDSRNEHEAAAQFFWIIRNRCDEIELAKGMNFAVSRARDLIARWRANEAAKQQKS